MEDANQIEPQVSEAILAEAGVVSEDSLADCDGEVLQLASDGALLEASPSAAFLATALKKDDGAFRDFVLGEGPAAETHLALRSGSERRRYLLTLFVEPCGKRTLIGRDVTLTESLTGALMHSRDLLQDLVRASSSFGFECDCHGRFTWAGPDDVLGHAPADIVGKDAAALLFEGGKCPTPLNPFNAARPMTHDQLLMVTASGAKCHMSVTAVPFYDSSGNRTGTRGSVRDVSEAFEQDRARKAETGRLRMMNHITALMRTETGSQALMSGSLDALAGALRADSGWVMLQEAGGLRTAARFGGEDLGNIDALESGIAKVLQAGGGTLDSDDEGHQFLDVEGREVFVIPLFFEDGHKAAVALSRDTNTYPWSLAERLLMEGVADHLAIALRQAILVERLEMLSSTDELSGLLNRRAFDKAVERRLGLVDRSGRSSCFLYVDLDHFKQVNDRMGHAAGDAVIAWFGKYLQSHARVGDIVARLGGDEFALWLEDTNKDGAVIKAEKLLGLADQLREVAGDDSLDLSMSIGIAEAGSGGNHSLSSISVAADQALYVAKESGRASWAIAPGDITEGQG